MGAPVDLRDLLSLLIPFGVTGVIVRPGQFLLTTADPNVQISLRFPFGSEAGAGPPGFVPTGDGAARITFSGGLQQTMTSLPVEIADFKAAARGLPGVSDVAIDLDGTTRVTIGGQPRRFRPALTVGPSPAGSRRALVVEADGNLTFDTGDGRRQRFTIVP